MSPTIKIGDLVQDIRDQLNGFTAPGIVTDSRDRECHGVEQEFFVVWSYGHCGWWIGHYLTKSDVRTKYQGESILNYKIEDVTKKPELWCNDDPVRPDLNTAFKTAPGRGVFGLLAPDGEYKAFLCYALTSGVPKDVKQLNMWTTTEGTIVVPYTVWSLEKGAGRCIINKVLEFVQATRMAERVVTLSPPTDMARIFHLRNSALELQVNEKTVNFEYAI